MVRNSDGTARGRGRSYTPQERESRKLNKVRGVWGGEEGETNEVGEGNTGRGQEKKWGLGIEAVRGAKVVEAASAVGVVAAAVILVRRSRQGQRSRGRLG